MYEIRKDLIWLQIEKLTARLALHYNRPISNRIVFFYFVKNIRTINSYLVKWIEMRFYDRWTNMRLSVYFFILSFLSSFQLYSIPEIFHLIKNFGHFALNKFNKDLIEYYYLVRLGFNWKKSQCRIESDRRREIVHLKKFFFSIHSKSHTNATAR